MSPDIEWYIGDEAEPDAPNRLSQPKQSPPWRWLLLGMGIVAVLAVARTAYDSPAIVPAIPTLTLNLTITPEPTRAAPRPPIEDAIAQEAQALARGDRAAILAMQDSIDKAWYRAPQKWRDLLAEPWGSPVSNSPLYTVFASGTLHSGRAWVDIRQFRNSNNDPDVYFRETRFYAVRGDRWLRVGPDRSFWAGQRRSGSTPHFDLLYPAEDEDVIHLAADHFERAYLIICADLGCPIDPQSNASRALTLTLIFDPDVIRTMPIVESEGQGVTIRLPSPRVIGIFDWDGDPADQLEGYAYHALALPLARLAAGRVGYPSSLDGGEFFIRSIADWERNRLKSPAFMQTGQIVVTPAGRLTRHLSSADDTQPSQDYSWILIYWKDLLPLEALWQSDPLSPESQASSLIPAETDAVVSFIAHRFGPEGVVHFLHVIGSAGSFSQAVEDGLGLTQADFERQWMTRVGR